MKNSKVNIYTNGVEIRTPNKRVTILEDEEGNATLRFWFADKDADKPAVWHGTLRDKVRLSSIKLEKNTLDMITRAWALYRDNQLKNTN